MARKDAKETEFGYFHPIRFREANGVAVDEQARTARVILITEGLGNLRDRNFYTKEAVATAKDVFNGKQFYVDHPGSDDEENRPERSVRDLAGYFYDTNQGAVQDPDTGENLQACFATLRFADSEPGRLAFDQVKTALEYQKRFPGTKDTYAGISINGGGVSHPGTVAGMPVNMVTEIKEAFSADIVTKPARGGKFMSMMKESEAVREWNMRRAHGVRFDASTRVSGETEGGEKMQDTKVAEAKRKKVDNKETKKRVSTGEGLQALGEKLSRLTNVVHEPPDDPKELIADIQGDLDALYDVLDDLKTVKDEAKAEAEARRKKETKMAKELEAKKEAEDEAKKAAEAKAAEAEDEAKKESEDEEEAKKASEDDEMGDEMDDDDDMDMGMGDEDHEDDEEAGVRMRYQCEACAAENEVMPPKGYSLVKREQMYAESKKGGIGAVVGKLRRTLEAKEMRFAQANKEKHALFQENVRLKARLAAYERVIEARKALKEAGIPKDILNAQELALVEPTEWPLHIKSAKRALEHESKLIAKGGNAPKGADTGTAVNADPVAAFRESYTKK